MERIDAHHHVWDLARRAQPWLADLPALDRSFGLDDLVPALVDTGVTGTVLVQANPITAETEELLALAAAQPLIRGVIGWVDLTAGYEQVHREVARLQQVPGGELLVGVRHPVQGERDPEWLSRPDVVTGLHALAAAGLVFDLLIAADQLPASIMVAGLVPELRFVLDHLGKPRIAERALDPWRAQLSHLATRDNVTAKLSGMFGGAPAGRFVEQVRPFAEHLLSCFGSHRVMVGSDWPMSLLSAQYTDVLTATDALLRDLPVDELADVRAGVAIRTYELASRSGRGAR